MEELCDCNDEEHIKHQKHFKDQKHPGHEDHKHEGGECIHPDGRRHPIHKTL